MIPILNLRGYQAVDPLDDLPALMRYGLGIVVTAIASLLLVYAITDLFHVVVFIGPWFEVVEVVGYALIAAPLVIFFRKSSSLVPYALVLVPLVLLDIYLQANVRSRGVPALWDYPEGTAVWLIPIYPFRFFVTISVDAILIGPLCLWCARLAARYLVPRHRIPPRATNEQYAALFPPGQTDPPGIRPKRGGGYWILRLLGFGYCLYLGLLLIGSLGADAWPDPPRSLLAMTYRNPIFGAATMAKILVMTLLAFTGAYHRRLRWQACWLLIAGHMVSILSSLLFWKITDVAGQEKDFLLTSAIVDGVMVGLFFFIKASAAADRSRFPETHIFPGFFSVPAMVGRLFYALVGGVCLSAAGGILFFRLTGNGGEVAGVLFTGPDPTLCNTLTLCVTMGIVAFLVRTRMALRDAFDNVFAVGLGVPVIALIVWLIAGETTIRDSVGARVHVDAWVAGVAAGFALLGSAMSVVRSMTYNVEYTITTLSPQSARGVLSLHNALFETVDDSGEVLQCVDRFAGSIRGRKRGLLNFPFWLLEVLFPLTMGLHPPFSMMDEGERRYFLRRYVMRTPSERRRAFLPLWADVAHTLGTAAQAIVMLAAYSCVRKQHEIGYVPPGARDRFQADVVSAAPPFTSIARLPRNERDKANFVKGSLTSRSHRVAPRVVTPVDEHRLPDEVDYLVVGSGPGGAVMGYRLAAAADPSRVLIVERGPRISPLQDSNDREIEMLPKLYKEGGLQQTKRSEMMVLQGECVGGGSVLYNAVCYAIPKPIEAIWTERFGVPMPQVREEYTRVARELGIQRLARTGMNTKVARKFEKGVRGYNARFGGEGKLSEPDVVHVNALESEGDGLWNIGNHTLRKRSMLETYIPWGEAAGMKVISNTTAVRFMADGDRANAVLLRTAGGDFRTIRVRKGVVVAGGVIASSHFLFRSGVRGNVGRNMSCNFAFPMAFEFSEELRAFDGEQITMGALDPQCRAIFETYFNPPAAFALSLPINGQRHRDLMLRYDCAMNIGALIGSEPNGVVERKADLINGQAFTWTLGAVDRDHIRYALNTLLRLGQAAGARRAYVPTRPGLTLELRDDVIADFESALANFPLTLDDLVITTAHPQGGNIMASDAARADARDHRVVNQRFQVDGFSNVFVADASVFPTSLTINPQWTIMAMSSLAARHVLEACA
jgi:choline dehydrogenase-like flavoprotein